MINILASCTTLSVIEIYQRTLSFSASGSELLKSGCKGTDFSANLQIFLKKNAKNKWDFYTLWRKSRCTEYEHIIIYYIGGWEIGKTEKGNMHDLSLMAMGTIDDNDNVNKINEHGSLGWSRMIIYKNILVTIWFLTLNYRKLYVNHWIRID